MIHPPWILYPVHHEEGRKDLYGLTSLNWFQGLVPMCATSLPCRAGNKLDFNPVSLMLSIHLVLLALHAKSASECTSSWLFLSRKEAET